ncbi:Hypothetical predicted protein [Drosophila guanche]|uniref:Uncharacterized protein n=1 Tax=Drosophila guanche TaxID=7266 RepID=A0A3B0K105_DROGU|nr:Hypothetical predicted protein [Drosophila guanche]
MAGSRRQGKESDPTMRETFCPGNLLLLSLSLWLLALALALAKLSMMTALIMMGHGHSMVLAIWRVCSYMIFERQNFGLAGQRLLLAERWGHRVSALDTDGITQAASCKLQAAFGIIVIVRHHHQRRYEARQRLSRGSAEAQQRCKKWSGAPVGASSWEHLCTPKARRLLLHIWCDQKGKPN